MIKPVFLLNLWRRNVRGINVGALYNLKLCPINQAF